MKIQIQARCSYADSMIWQLTDHYFQERGLAIWRCNEVPFWITSNATLAYQTARVVWEALNLMADPPHLFYVLELGAGSGVFAYHFLVAWQSMVQNEPSARDPLPTICYILTDYSEQIVKEASMNQRLQDFCQRGWLQFAICDGRQPHLMKSLDGSLKNLEPQSIGAVLFNYLLCSLPLRVFHYDQGQFFERYLALYQPLHEPSQRPWNYQPAFDLQALEWQESYEPVALPAELDALLGDFFSFSAKMSLPYATVGVELLQAILPLLRPGGVLLTSDFAYATWHELKGWGQAKAYIYGNSLVHQVAFPLLAVWLQHQRYPVMQTTTPTNALQTLLLYQGPTIPLRVQASFNHLFMTHNRNERPGQQARHRRECLDVLGI